MPRTFTCHHCGITHPINPRLKKKQKYCSRKTCQEARRRSWKKGQYHNSKSYRKKHLEVQRTWRKHRPAHTYQKEYRETHQEYVNRNRELQRERNKRRQKYSGPMIVNGNALSLQPSDGMAYAIIQVKETNDCKWELVHARNVGIIRARDNLTLQ